MLAILTGLEINSAKSGVKPDLSEYLIKGKRKRSAFLEYKKLFEDKENRTGIMNDQYSPNLQAAIEKCRDAKTSIETLPAIADDLKKNTPKIKAKKVKDNMLFLFATSPEWKKELDEGILEQVESLIKEYKACLSRIRIANRQSVKQMQIPLFHPKTKGAWVDHFDDVIADALELGPLRNNSKPLPDEIKAKIEAVELSEKLCNGDKKKVREAMEFLTSYYIANKQPDTEWIQHSTISFDAYLGPSFSKKYLPKIPRDIITRDEKQQVGGVARYKVNPEFLP